MRALLIDASDTLSSVTPTPSVFVQPSNLFTSPLPLSSSASTFSTLFTSPLPVSSPAPKLSLTPKIDRVRSVAPSVGVIAFTAPLNFLNRQSSFNHTFGLDPIMIQIIKHSKRHCTTEETYYFASKDLAFCNIYRLRIFCNYVQLKFVGTTSYYSQKMLTDISFALSNLQMVYNHRGREFLLVPDDLFSRYTEFLPLFSPNALTWSFSLVTLFFHTLYLELQEAVRRGGGGGGLYST